MGTLTIKTDLYFVIEVKIHKTISGKMTHHWDFEIKLGELVLYYSDLYYDSEEEAQTVAERMLSNAIVRAAGLNHEIEREFFNQCTSRYL